MAPQKRPEEATRGRNSRETTAGASKCNGIRAKPQREHAGASKPRTRPTARAVAVGNLSSPPRRGLKRPREAGIRAKPQREHRNATEFARNHSEHRNATEFARNHSGSVETKAPSHRALRCGRQPNWPPSSGSIEMQRNSRETMLGPAVPSFPCPGHTELPSPDSGQRHEGAVLSSASEWTWSALLSLCRVDQLFVTDLLHMSSSLNYTGDPVRDPNLENHPHQVLLASDPDAVTASSALSVHVGFYSDPEDICLLFPGHPEPL